MGGPSRDISIPPDLMPRVVVVHRSTAMIWIEGEKKFWNPIDLDAEIGYIAKHADPQPDFLPSP